MPAQAISNRPLHRHWLLKKRGRNPGPQIPSAVMPFVTRLTPGDLATVFCIPKIGHRYFEVIVPENVRQLSVISLFNHHLRLYVKYGSLPSASNFDAQGLVMSGDLLHGFSSEAEIDAPQPGHWYCLVRAHGSRPARGGAGQCYAPVSGGGYDGALLYVDSFHYFS